MVEYCTEQYALAISDQRLRALLADQPQNFALIFSISEVPPFALLRVGSKVTDVTLHIRRGIVLCRWLRLFAQHPRLSESCASCPLLQQILRRLFVSPSVNDPPFSSISTANYGLTSLRNVTQLGSALRVVGREQSSSGTTVDSLPFFLGLHPFITFFVIEGVDPDPLCFSFFHTRLSGSPPVTLRIAHVRIIALFSSRLVNTHTRCGWTWRRLRHRNGFPRKFLFMSTTIARA